MQFGSVPWEMVRRGAAAPHSSHDTPPHEHHVEYLLDDLSGKRLVCCSTFGDACLRTVEESRL
jgi:hypothetical protein